MNVVAGVMFEPLGWMIVHSVWLLLLPSIVLAVALWLLPEHWPRARYAVALGTLFSMVLLPFCVLLWEQHSDDSAMAETVVQLPLNAEEHADDFADTSVDDSASVPNIEVSPAEVVGSSAHVSGSPMPLADGEDVVTFSSTPVALPLEQRIRPLLPWAVGLWFAGALLMTIRLSLGWRTTLQLRRSGSQAVPAAIQEMLDRLKLQMGVTATVRVLQSTLVNVPSVVGHFSPVVLLPVAAITGLSTDQLRAVLAHELAHVRRYDYAVNILQTVIETVLFYHPVMWWVSRVVRDEREYCCDEMALAVTCQPAELASALMTVGAVRAAAIEGQTDYEFVAAANGGNLLRRIRRIAQQPVDTRMGRRSWVPVVMVLSVLTTAVFVSVVPKPVDAGDQSTAEPAEIQGDEPKPDDVSNPVPVVLLDAPVDVPLPTEKFPSFARFPASGTGIRVKLDDRRWVEFNALASVDKIDNGDLKVFWKADGELIDPPKNFDPTVLVPDLVDDRIPEVNREVLLQVVGPKGTRVGISTSGSSGYVHLAAPVNDEFEQFPLNSSMGGIQQNHAYVEVRVTKEDWEDVPLDAPEIARLLYSDEPGSLPFASDARGLYVLAEDANEYAWILESQRDNEESFTGTPGTVGTSIDRIVPESVQKTLSEVEKKLGVATFFFAKDKPMPKIISLRRSRYDYVRFDNLSVFPGPRSAVQVSVNGMAVNDGGVVTTAPEVVTESEAEVIIDDEQKKPDYLTLTGTVVDSKNQPVSNCWVGMFTNPQVFSDNYSPPGFVDGPELSHEALTDSKGRFTIFAAKTHFVFEGAFWAVGRDGASGVKALNATWSYTKNNLKVRIDDKVGKVRILAPDGQPISKANVTLDAVQVPRSVTRQLPPEVQQRQMATTDVNGVARFLGWPSAGIRGVIVTADGYGTQVLNHRLASRWVKGDEPLTLTLRQTARFKGRVEDFDSQRHRGLRLQVQTESYEGPRPRLNGRVVVEVQEDGSFEVDMIAAGRVSFVSSLSPDSLSKIRYANVPVLKPGEDRVLENNPRVEKAVVVRQQLIKADTGEGVAGISLRALWGSAINRGSWRQSKPTQTDKNGWWSARVLPGKINIRISGGLEGYSGTAWFDGRNGYLGVEATIPHTDQVVTLPPERYLPAKKLNGRLRYADGSAAVDWSVYGHPISWQDVGVGGVHTDRNGGFTLTFPIGYPPRLFNVSNREWMTEHNFTDNYVRPEIVSLEPFVLQIPAPDNE